MSEFQPAFDLSNGETPRYMREHTGQYVPGTRPPPRPLRVSKGLRTERKELYTHFALVHLNRPQVPPRPSKPPEPWPQRCKTFHLMHKTEKAAKWWVEVKSRGDVYRTWLCPLCRHWHVEAYPHEASGTSSGKGFRKRMFLLKKGISFEKVYGITTPKT